jgi:hypothetical protein
VNVPRVGFSVTSQLLTSQVPKFTPPCWGEATLRVLVASHQLEVLDGHQEVPRVLCPYARVITTCNFFRLSTPAASIYPWRRRSNGTIRV